MKHISVHIFACAFAVQLRLGTPTGVRAANALAIAEHKVGDALAMAANTPLDDEGAVSSGAFLETSGEMDNSALMSRVRKVEALAATEGQAVQAQQQALQALQEEQMSLAAREDALESRQAAQKQATHALLGSAKKSDSAVHHGAAAAQSARTHYRFGNLGFVLLGAIPVLLMAFLCHPKYKRASI